MANWERKSAHLLREIVKFRTYIDCLQAAQAQKEKIYADRPKPVQDLESFGEATVASSTETPTQGTEAHDPGPASIAPAET